MRRPVLHHIDGSRVVVTGPDGGPPRSTFDFEMIGFSRYVANGITRAFVALNGHTTIESQRLVWRQLKCLAASQCQFGKCPSILPQNCMDQLDGWMRRRGYNQNTDAATHTAIGRVLRWCLRNSPEMIDPKVKILAAPHQSKKPPEACSLNEQTIKSILSVCYSEIEEIEARIIACRELPLSHEPSLEGDLILRFLVYGHGHIPSSADLLHRKGGNGLMWHIKKYGGLQLLATRYYLNLEDIFPFYLALLVQTSGNPQALLSLTRDCIRPHPIRSDLERIVWDKPRAAREQYPDFPKDKTWSAPNIARRLISLNEDLVSIAEKSHRNELFLCRNARRGVFAPSWQGIHDCFRRFREKHNLPDFQLRELRKAGAVLHHRAGRSIVAAQKRLNHSDSTTTQLYTPLSDRKFDHDLTILKFQGLLVSESINSTRLKSKKDSTSTVSKAQTIFGFSCADPMAGVAPGSTKGEMCLQFCSCATCPGAMIPVDSPSAIARILNARDGLAMAQRRAFKEGWSPRFQAIYAPILGIIEREILPSITESVLEKARKIPRIGFMHLE